MNTEPIKCNGCKKPLGNYGGCATLKCEGVSFWGRSNDQHKTPGRMQREAMHDNSDEAAGIGDS